MVAIYANLIVKGVKTIDDVPDKLKKAVQAVLDEREKENDAKHY